ncbi:MAG: DUF2505 family protein [Polyangiaceae bacterium]
MRFEIVHEFEIPLDALELAVLSPQLWEKLAARLKNIEVIQQTKHDLEDGVLDRVWSFQANVKIPAFAERYVTKEMCAWKEHTHYSLAKHSSEWTIEPNVKPEWQKYFESSGSYELRSTKGGSTKRVVTGKLELKVPRGLRELGERMIVSEVKKTFEAEAATLRDLATLS